MTDHRNEGGAPYDDLQLITEYLTERLDPERVALVRRRLEEDAEFRELAAPLVMVASVPKQIDEPLPPGELEKHWDEFTRKAGFIHQRRRARMRRLKLLALAAILAVPAWMALRTPVAILAWRAGFREVPSADSVRLPDGAVAQLEPGARLLVHRNYMKDTARFVWLHGNASFTVPEVEPVRRFYVVGEGGLVHTVGSEFRVRHVGDTTEVLGGPAGADDADATGQEGVTYLAQHAVREDYQQVFWGQRARVASGMPVMKDPPRRPPPPQPVQAGGAAPPPVKPAPRPRPKVQPLPRLRASELGDMVIDPHGRNARLGERMSLPMGVVAHIDSATNLGVFDPGEFSPGQLLGLRSGGALFLVPRDTANPGTYVTWIGTRAGYVAAMAPVAVAIWMQGDTMLVRVHRHARQENMRDPFFGEHRVQLVPVLIANDRPQFFVDPGQTARMVRGQHPELVP